MSTNHENGTVTNTFEKFTSSYLCLLWGSICHTFPFWMSTLTGMVHHITRNNCFLPLRGNRNATVTGSMTGSGKEL